MEPDHRREQLHRWLAFLISFALLLGYLLLRNEQEKPYDAWTYTQLAASFAQNGLLNFSAYANDCGDSMRGYLFPWLLAICEGLAHGLPLLDYRLVISLFSALVCAVVLPDLLTMIFSVQPMAWYQRVLVPTFMLVFFNGLLAYPLTDLWGAGFAILSVYGLLYAATRPRAALGARLGMMLLSGFSLGAAYNIRTIYLFLAPGLVALFLGFVLLRREIPARRKAAWLGCLLAGFALVSLPQSLINHSAYGSYSPLLISPSGSHLYINKLYDGIYITKYESYTGVDYWYESMDYADPAGQALLEAEGLPASFEFGTGAEELTGLGDYFALVLRHPLDFLGIYGRHLFSLLDVRYPNIYVDTLEQPPWVALGNMTLLYLSLTALWALARGMEKGRRGRLWALFALVPPVAASLPGSIETRYGILGYLLLWGAAAACVRGKTFRALRPRNILSLALGYGIFLVLMCTVNGLISATLLEYPLLYS